MFDTEYKEQVPALTIRQPWASLIVCGAKKFETRSWPPPRSLVGGRIVIHAGKAPLPCDLSSEALVAIEVGLGLPFSEWHCLPRGAVVGTAIIASASMVGERSTCFRRLSISATLPGSPASKTIELNAAECHFGDYDAGRWLWELVGVQPITPSIRALGQQRIWHWKWPLMMM